MRTANDGRPAEDPAVGAAAVALARVITDEPAAVLLIDLGAGLVVYANELAAQLARLQLPVDVAEWSHAAGLQTAAGGELETSPTPLERVAAGHPVNGEIVTAAKGADFAAAREQLWVLGTPLTDAPEGLRDHALVLFLPLRDTSAILHAQQAGLDLRHEAVLASEVAFTIADPNTEDDPLIWVNPAFERTTGYRPLDVLGRNCRFLQGPLTDRASVARIREGLRSNRTVTETLLNYRADGTAFWNRLVISPIFGPDGRVTHHVGVQTDVTDRVDADEVRDRALAAAEMSTHRQHAIATVGSSLAAYSSDPQDLLAAAPGLITSHFWGWCAVVTLDARGAIDQVFTAYGQPANTADQTGQRDTELAERVITAYLNGPGRVLLDRAHARTNDPALWPARLVVPEDVYTGLIDDPALLVPGMADTPGGRSLIAAPLSVSGRIIGLVTLSRPGVDELTDPNDAAALADIATRISTAWDNARLYASEHDVALTLQQSLLPRLPTIAGFDIQASYIPASNAEVGGDWFDVVDLPDRALATIIGDVVGHDIHAAATMGHLRSIVRTLAWQRRRPRELLGELQELVGALEPQAIATMLYAVVDKPEAVGAPSSVTYSRAGHVPALLRHPDGTVEVLGSATNPPIGVSTGRSPIEASATLPNRGALVLFTDGLIERRDRDIDDGIAAVSRILAATAADESARQLLDKISDALLDGEQDDDTCILVVVRDDAPEMADKGVAADR